MPIEAITAAEVAGPDWNIAAPGADGPAPAGGGDGGSGFGGLVAEQLGALSELQTDAAAAGQALATGTATDASQVVMAVERAQLSMQLAAQLRDKSLESFQEIFRTQV
jgi:flagellar hook-basal body complex protein FliE